MPPRKPTEQPADEPDESQDLANVEVAVVQPDGTRTVVPGQVGTRPDNSHEGLQLDAPPALTGDGSKRDDETADENPYGTVKIVSTGPTVVIHGQTLAYGQDAIVVPNDVETQEQVAAGLIAVAE